MAFSPSHGPARSAAGSDLAASCAVPGGGAQAGGASQAGRAQIGSTQAGITLGGSTLDGRTLDGRTQGAAVPGGARQGVPAQGVAQGMSAQGGLAQRGSVDQEQAGGAAQPGGLTAAEVFTRMGAALASGALDMAAGAQGVGAWLASCLATRDGAAPSEAGADTDTDLSALSSTSGQGMAQDSAVRRAVDAALVAERQRQRDVSAALAMVRPLVGDVLGMDSAEDILRYALRECGVETQGVNVAGLRALVAARAGMAGSGVSSGGSFAGAHDSVAGGDFATRYGLSAPRKF